MKFTSSIEGTVYKWSMNTNIVGELLKKGNGEIKLSNFPRTVTANNPKGANDCGNIDRSWVGRGAVRRGSHKEHPFISHKGSVAVARQVQTFSDRFTV